MIIILPFLMVVGLSPAFAGSMNYVLLQEIIQTKNVKTIDELIPLLPEEYRKSYTFMYNSRSAQAETTSPEYPRAIVFGEDSKFVITFTKSPSLHPQTPNVPDTLEIMEWNEKNSSFEFREMTFNGKEAPTATEANPQKCLSCHGDPPTPIWDSYNLWPGAYGSVSTGCEVIFKGSKEEKYYKKFLKTGRKSSRYKDLPREVTPATSYCDHINRKNTFVTNGKGNTPNSEFTHQLQELNRKRIQTAIRNSDQYENFRSILIAINKKCISKDDDLSSFLSPQIGHTGRNYQEHLTEIYSKRDESGRQKFLQAQKLSGSKAFEMFPENSFVPDKFLAQMRFLAERLGVNPESLSNSFDHRFNILGPLDTIHSLDRIMKEWLRPEDQSSDLSCEELGKRSLQETALAEHCPAPETTVSGEADSMKNQIEVIVHEASMVDTISKLESCKNCHTKQSMGGFSFDVTSRETIKNDLKNDPGKLIQIRDYLRGFMEGGEKVTQMPLSKPPFSDEDQRMILSDLEKLVK